MFWTRSRGSGKITVEFFSALMLFNVWEEKVIDKVVIMMIMGMTMVKIGMLYFVIRGGGTCRYRNCKAELL